MPIYVGKPSPDIHDEVQVWSEKITKTRNKKLKQLRSHPGKIEKLEAKA
jgi:hypothetical protein